jgi:hypothetical protein
MSLILMFDLRRAQGYLYVRCARVVEYVIIPGR